MNYYKIIIEEKIVDVSFEKRFVKMREIDGILVYCTKTSGQYLQGRSEELYHADWMSEIITDKYSYKNAVILEISETEYEPLLKAFETEDEITEVSSTDIDELYDNEETTPEPKPQEPTTEYIRSVKLKEMSYNCNKTITNGFDIILSDGNIYHFSLTTQDQLNLITLSSMVESGETQIPYHADGEPCKFYSATDIKSIINKATEFKTYHISYYNSLKTYINSMETIEEIAAVTYGIEIPEEYQSEVLKAII